MKKIAFIFFLTLGTIAVNAQELKWYTNVNDAMKVSQKTKKPLFLFFTGSDWCGWCMRLQKEVFKTPEFTKWAEKNVILVELDFPRKAQDEATKQQNAQLAATFGIKGYPTVWFADAEKTKDGKVNFKALGSSGYIAGGPATWLENANAILATRKR